MTEIIGKIVDPETPASLALVAPQDASPENFSVEDTDRASLPEKQIGPGRPSKITPELITKIANAVKNGSFIETAAAYSGINKDTLYEWLKKGAVAVRKEEVGKKKLGKKEELYASFTRAMEVAFAESEIRDTLCVTRAIQEGIWQAAAWRLSRKHPDRWAEKTEQKVTGAGPQGEIVFTLKIADTKEAAQQEEEEVRAGTTEE